MELKKLPISRFRCCTRLFPPLPLLLAASDPLHQQEQRNLQHAKFCRSSEETRMSSISADSRCCNFRCFLLQVSLLLLFL